MAEPEIREATEDDAATISGLIVAAFEPYRRRLDPPSGAHLETAESIRRRLPTRKAALATVDGRAVGCVLYELGDGFVTMSRLSVLQGERRRGIGRALIAFVEGRARDSGRSRVRLGVRIVLPRLHAYYSRLGYRKVGLATHAGFSRPTYAILEKDLEAPGRA